MWVDVQSEVFRLTARWWAAGFLRTITVRSSYSASTCQLPTEALRAVFQSIVVNKLSYASPAWWGSLLPMIGDVLEAFMRRSATLGYREDSTLTFDSICTKTDDKLFSSITDNRHQLLHPLLPPATSTTLFSPWSLTQPPASYSHIQLKR